MSSCTLKIKEEFQDTLRFRPDSHILLSGPYGGNYPDIVPDLLDFLQVDHYKDDDEKPIGAPTLQVFPWDDLTTAHLVTTRCFMVRHGDQFFENLTRSKNSHEITFLNKESGIFDTRKGTKGQTWDENKEIPLFRSITYSVTDANDENLVGFVNPKLRIVELLFAKCDCERSHNDEVVILTNYTSPKSADARNKRKFWQSYFGKAENIKARKHTSSRAPLSDLSVSSVDDSFPAFLQEPIDDFVQVEDLGPIDNLFSQQSDTGVNSSPEPLLSPSSFSCGNGSDTVSQTDSHASSPPNNETLSESNHFPSAVTIPETNCEQNYSVGNLTESLNLVNLNDGTNEERLHVELPRKYWNYQSLLDTNRNNSFVPVPMPCGASDDSTTLSNSSVAATEAGESVANYDSDEKSRKVSVTEPDSQWVEGELCKGKKTAKLSAATKWCEERDLGNKFSHCPNCIAKMTEVSQTMKYPAETEVVYEQRSEGWFVARVRIKPQQAPR